MALRMVYQLLPSMRCYQEAIRLLHNRRFSILLGQIKSRRN